MGDRTLLTCETIHKTLGQRRKMDGHVNARKSRQRNQLCPRDWRRSRFTPRLLRESILMSLAGGHALGSAESCGHSRPTGSQSVGEE